MIESLLGYIIGGLSFLAGLCIMLIRNVDSVLVESRRTIKDQFINAYSEFADSTIAETIDVDRLKASIRRLKDLHCASHWDLIKLRIIEVLIRKSFVLMMFVWGLVAISLATGHLGFDENSTVCRFIFLVIIPAILLVIQVMYVAWMINREQYIKRVKDNYKNLEYMA